MTRPTEAGLSRLWGGIHVSADDFNGRKTGAECGRGAWKFAQQYFDGSAGSLAPHLKFRRLAGGQYELHCPTVRGFSYRIQSTTDLSRPFVDEPPERARMTENAQLVQRIDNLSERKFYRALRLSVSAP